MMLSVCPSISPVMLLNALLLLFDCIFMSSHYHETLGGIDYLLVRVCPIGLRFSPESEHGANAGLHVARDFLEPIKKQFPWISYADLYTLAGVTAVEEMGGASVFFHLCSVLNHQRQACPGFCNWT